MQLVCTARDLYRKGMEALGSTLMCCTRLNLGSKETEFDVYEWNLLFMSALPPTLTFKAIL